MLKIKEVIKERGLTVREVADRLNISRIALSQQINGTPKIDTLQRIADAVGVHVLDLFEDDRADKKSNYSSCPHCGKPLKIEKAD